MHTRRDRSLAFKIICVQSGLGSTATKQETKDRVRCVRLLTIDGKIGPFCESGEIGCNKVENWRPIGYGIDFGLIIKIPLV